jgi:hypothetical protein
MFMAAKIVSTAGKVSELARRSAEAVFKAATPNMTIHAVAVAGQVLIDGAKAKAAGENRKVVDGLVTAATITAVGIAADLFEPLILPTEIAHQ